MSTVSLKQSPNSGFSNSRKAHVTINLGFPLTI